MSLPAGFAATAPRGFTLVEVVIALSLTTLILLGLGSALFAFGKSSGRIEEGLARIETMRIVPNFLRSALGSVADAPTFESGVARAEGFSGTRGELRWTGALPGRHGMGGLHHLRLFAERRADGPVLLLQYLPYTGPGRMPDWHEIRPHTLVNGIESFSIAYKAPSPGAWNYTPVWLDEWTVPGRLPDAVRLSITAAGTAWPPLIVPLYPVPVDDDSAESVQDGMPS